MKMIAAITTSVPAMAQALSFRYTKINSSNANMPNNIIEEIIGPLLCCFSFNIRRVNTMALLIARIIKAENKLTLSQFPLSINLKRKGMNKPMPIRDTMTITANTLT